MNEGIVSAISVFPSGIFYLLLIVIVSASVPARISKGQGAGPEKGLFNALLDFQKRHFLGTLVKSNKVYNEILTFIIYT